MRASIQTLYLLRRFLLRLFRIRTRGVKVMVFNPAGELLLVRNSYGHRDLFVLPGGGIHRSESAEAAAAREVREETGLELRGLAFLSTHLSEVEGKRDTIQLFSATAEGCPIADAVEVEEAAFFPLDALPETVSAATLRRIEEHRGVLPPRRTW